MINKDFKNLFAKRELEEIRGSKDKNIKILSGILIGTFLAIAVSKGGLEYLSIKMKDPFVQNLEIEVPYSKAMLVEDFKAFLNVDSLKETFKYDTVLSYVEYPLIFWSFKANDFKRAKGRTIEPGNPLLKKILDKRNLIIGRSFRDEYDCGFIVTEKLLDEFGYNGKTKFIQMAVAKIPDGYYNVTVPIIAVVKELPGLASFAFTPYFYKVRNSGVNNSYNISDHRDINIYFPNEDGTDITGIKSGLEKYLLEHPEFKNMDPYIEIFDDHSGYLSAKILNIIFYPEPESIEVMDTIYDNINNYLISSFRLNEYYRSYRYDFPSDPYMEIAFDKISIVFYSLRRINQFKEFLFNQFELDVEMSKVRDKENFTAISILTYSIATMLLFFSLVSLGFFIYNLLKSHLDKIKMNLGTFQAFGMSNKALTEIYRIIIRKFVMISIIYAYTISLIINTIIVTIFFPELSYFQLISFHALVAILLMWLLVEYVFRKGAQSILNCTPGDLIYGRE